MRGILPAVLAAVLAFLVAPPSAAATAPVRIMPLGDSITAGPGCWRAVLWDRLQRSGYPNIDFVGTQVGGGCSVAHDGDHEGHSGLQATGIANQNQLPGWLSATNPRIVLMHLGTNDLWGGTISTQQILTAYSTLVDQMRANNPNMKIIVAQLVPMEPSNCTGCAQRVVALNNAIPGWAAGKTTPQSPITVVDQWTGFNATTDTVDGVHPVDSGFRKMSDRWYPALVSAIGGTTPPDDPPPPSAGTCVASYRAVSEWGDGYQGEVSVRNGTTAATSSWTATFSFANGQQISQSWNATVTQNGAAVTARNVNWNGGRPRGTGVASGPRFHATAAHRHKPDPDRRPVDNPVGCGQPRRRRSPRPGVVSALPQAGKRGPEAGPRAQWSLPGRPAMDSLETYLSTVATGARRCSCSG